MVISYLVCHDSPDKQDIHMVIKQGEKVIQPEKVNVDFPNTTSRWPNSPAYSSWVNASFAYDSIKTKEKATVIVVPQIGENTEWDLDLSEFE
ncbi:MAG TPA: hypothetical protein VGB26_05070 [Nitrospiria bacterium]|jgi:hypothetical protein